MDLSATEADMVQQKVQAILRGLDGEHSGLHSDPGMLRWTLHKSLDRNPAIGNIMVGVLIKELEKAELGDNLHYIIPLLHTLMHVITKAAYISNELYERVYVFCKKILTLPKPYCTIGLDYAQKLKTEKKVPGFSYQKMVVSEQNLKRDITQQQGKVLLFLDPGLVSEAVCNTLLRETQAGQMSHTPTACMIYVITNCIQAALGKDCDITLLQRVLKDQPTEEVELRFQEILSVVEHSEQVIGSRQRHSDRIRELYSKIIISAEEGVPMSKLQRIPLPSPNISVHLWTDDDQLWKELMLFTRETEAAEAEAESFKMPDLTMDTEGNEQNRISVWSNDSGIERDLPGVEEKELAKLYRKPCIKKRGAELDSAVLLQNLTKAPRGSRTVTLQRLSGQSTELSTGPDKLPTRVVILGDDRALGRLAKAYYSFRKREARRPHRTLKANLQFYCIPVQGEQTDTSSDTENSSSMSDTCELSTYLGQVDPWYDRNINTLCNMIAKLTLMPPCLTRDSMSDPFILDVTSYYLRFGLQPVYFQIYNLKVHFRDMTLEPVEDVFLTELKVEMQDCTFTKLNTLNKKKAVMDFRGAGIQVHYTKALASNREKEGSLVLRTSGATIKTIPNKETEDLVCLNVYIDEMTKSSSGRSASCKVNGLKASSIQMRSLELRTLSLQLDKDSRRIYTNVSSFEVSPCLEPGYSLQKMRASRAHWEGKEDGGLSIYMTKSLLLPINTFAGIIQ
ncbi:phosphoinositide 3-kinase regulatory subunit 6 [Pseudophryne corroboree]|uniref:phosphoinositide 3-kinase regulatory subunit 6 n=1 Tax=Pseudophryne corroboree TaxID=495146 RepID=UPI00308149B6